MSNLLLKEDKKKIEKEICFRSVIVFFSLLFFSISVASVLLTPSFVLTSIKESITQNETKNFKQKETDIKEIQELVIEKQKLETLKTIKEKQESILEIFNITIRAKSENIKISGLFYKNSGDLVLRGVASSRQSLMDFIDVLKKEEIFSAVDFPVSNLVKDKDIDFYLNIKIKQ